MKLKNISALSLFLLFSCGNYSYKNKSQSTWIIREINYESETTATYLAMSTDTADLAQENSWFTDSLGAFKVGDTLIFRNKSDKRK